MCRNDCSWLNEICYRYFCDLSCLLYMLRFLLYEYNECNFCQGWKFGLWGGNVLQLITQQVPVLLCGLEMWALPNRTLHTADFTMNHFLMKLVITSNVVVLEECTYFSRRTAICAASETLSEIFCTVEVIGKHCYLP